MKKYLHFIILFVFLIFGFFAHKLFTFTYITAEFDDLRPMKKFLPVYYKGLIVGRAKEARHSDNYHHTLVRIVLYPKNLLLPSNTTVELRKEKKNNKYSDFLELIYPKEPTLVMLSNHSTIKGVATVDVETFMANRHPDDLEEMKENLVSSTENLSYALQSLGEIFDNVNEILRENEKNINKSTKNIEKMTVKIDRAIDEEKIEQTLASIEQTTQNISKTTDNINQSYPKIDNSLQSLQDTMCNINAISCGVRRTLSERMGLAKLFFGRPVK